MIFLHIIHVLFVVLWIGGLAFVTILIFPLIYKIEKPLEKVLFFQRIEHRFAKLARVFSLVVIISGFVTLFHSGLYVNLFTSSPKGIFITFMMIIGIFWIVILFGVEKLVIKKLLEKMSQSPDTMNIDSIFKRMNVMHWVLLIMSLLVVVAGVLSVNYDKLYK
ncbi:MAG: hypothetical protein OEV44_01250 [Spirochaetota bacterium]|nr:hypothetical protein [Spirochaetota bacterium]